MAANPDSSHRKDSLGPLTRAFPPQVAILPVTSGAEGFNPDVKGTQKNLLGKVASLLQRTAARSREGSITSDTNFPSAQASPKLSHTRFAGTSPPPLVSIHNEGHSFLGSPASVQLPRPESFRETKYVSLEYDPQSKRKVLNSYEILREIGRGEHGKVKLARDLVSDQLVAIKVMSRKSKDKLLRIRKSLNHDQKYNDYEAKIRREIAIMKRCDHKYIVKFKEVLDDVSLYKIYLVLEYMEKGEIIWKRKSPAKSYDDNPSDLQLPCASNTTGKFKRRINEPLVCVASEENDLLSNEFLPNLTFKQSRKVFRHVLLGLEYLHQQGIIHRDIKPANLLVSSDYTVKISDFGVSFASSLDSADEGQYFSEMELAKTVGTPAFFAPELCQTSFSQNSSFCNPDSDVATAPSQDGLILPKVNHKIDIWALGVTFYCLLFGRVPFNAESEFALFDVIVHQELEFPESRTSFNSPLPVSEKEFELAKDLLRKLLDKNSATRYDIEEIKYHPFVSMDLENNAAELDELFFLNQGLDRNRGFGCRNLLNISSQFGSTDSAAGIVRRVNLSLSKAPNHELSLMTNLDSELSSDQRVSSPASDSAPSMLPHTATTTQQSRPPLCGGSVNLHSNPSTAGNYHLRGRASLIFHDMIDYGSNIRRDSTGSLEAPQIETKRNVGGNLYLQNQSAIDAFKDIQKTDKKQRKSSLYSVQGSLPPANFKALRSNGRTPSIPFPQIPMSQSLSKIKVGPISIDSGRRKSSVISLPLTESFASLDSLNDDYLSLKYQEHKKKKQGLKLMEESTSHLDAGRLASPNQPQDMSDKFRNFNLGTQMAKKPSAASEIPSEQNDEVEPPTSKMLFRNPPPSSLSLGSVSSLSSSDSGEEGNLTLKFSSKVAPVSRPPFLSLGHRAQSHDSNLQNLMLPVKKYHDMPFVFQDLFHELEDVPEALMQSNSVEDLGVVPEVSVLSVPVPEIEKVKKLHVTPNHSSPLRKEVLKSSSPPKAAAPQPVDTLNDDAPREIPQDPQINNGHYINHYSKEHVRSPFPLAKHLDGYGRTSKPSWKGTYGSRPAYNRSNSITLGLLQHERSDFS